MPVQSFQHLLTRFKANAPATMGEIEAFEKEASVNLPDQYRQFLLMADGGEGIVGHAGYAMLWRVADLLRFNREYEVQEYAPGLLIFGSDGGGEGFAFDLRRPEKAIVTVPFIGMSLADALPVADTFGGFLDHLATR